MQHKARCVEFRAQCLAEGSVISNPQSATGTGKSTGQFCFGSRLGSNILLCLALSLLIVSTGTIAFAQKNKAAPVSTGPLLKRTTTRHEARHFNYGGTFTIVGAPQGSIVIEGWNKSEVDITAEIELQAPAETDFDRLAAVNSFIFDEDSNHLRILTTGMHDKALLRRVAKDFPKALLGLPWKIDYHIRVPSSIDLEINGGKGPISLSGVEGVITLSAPQTDASLTLTGGTFRATVAVGKVSVIIPSRSWRGAGVEIQLAAGDLSVEFPAGFSGDIDADILRSGKIVNTYPDFEAREKPGLSERVVRARAGVGGAFLKFSVVEGTIYLKKKVEE